jgi:hypothetical protein
MWCHVLDMKNTPKRAQVLYSRLLPVSCFKRWLPLYTLCWRSIQKVHGCRHGLAPELAWEPLLLEQAMSRANHCLVVVLQYAILLQ